MACIDRATPCPHSSPTFLRHKPSDSVYFFQSKIYPKFDMNRMHLLCLASFSDALTQRHDRKREPSNWLCGILPPYGLNSLYCLLSF